MAYIGMWWKSDVPWGRDTWLCALGIYEFDTWNVRVILFEDRTAVTLIGWINNFAPQD